MKYILMVILGLAFLSFTAEKYYSVKFTENQLLFHWKNIEKTKAIIDKSNLPHMEVKYIIAALDSLQNDIKKNMLIDTATFSIVKKK
jgi:hypothetical protein